MAHMKSSTRILYMTVIRWGSASKTMKHSNETSPHDLMMTDPIILPSHHSNIFLGVQQLLL